MAPDSGDTRQIQIWRGKFGTEYRDRNAVDSKTIQSLVRMWSRLLQPIRPKPTSILEIGSNIGLNLRALSSITDAALWAVEPNREARKIIVDDKVLPEGHVLDGVAQDIPLEDASMEVVFTSGVLIHIAPEDLQRACREIYRVASSYIICSEYYSHTPREIPYRGMDRALFTRDFGKFWMNEFPALNVVDYGFFWTGDDFLDDLTWWIFKKP